MTTAAAWSPVIGPDANLFAEARRQTHHAAQWLVRLAHTYMVAEPEHAHAFLRWDGKRQALVTREFLPGLAQELRIPSFTLQFRERDQPARHVLDLDDTTPAEVEAWELVELLHRHLDRDRFSKTLPYDFPDVMTGDAMPYSSEGLADSLVDLANWFDTGSSILAAVAGSASANEVRCWPQTMHLGVVVPRRDNGGAALRAGLSLGDHVSAPPYFYVTPHDALTRIAPDHCLTQTELIRQADPVQHAIAFLQAHLAADHA